MRFSLLAAALVLLPHPLFAQVEAIQVRVAAANVREGPSTQDTIRAVLHEGDVRQVVGDVPYWYQIRLLDGQDGYIAKRLCVP